MDIIFKILNIFYLFMEALGLWCCTWAFSRCGEWRAALHCGTQVFHGGGFSCGARALGCSGLLALWHMRSSWTRDPIHTPCIVRQILNLWTKEVQVDITFEESLYFKGKFESDDPTCLVIFNFTKYV